MKAVDAQPAIYMKAKEDLFIGVIISHKNIVEHHSLFLFTLQCYVTQQQTEHTVAFHCSNGYAKSPTCYAVRTKPMLLICSGQCGSGLQDQQTEPVQIYCMQLHSHT